MSVYRVQRIFVQLRQTGYITSKQQRYHRADGPWRACPAVRTFTKKFFIDLGGKSLWKRLLKEGAVKLEKIKSFVLLSGMTLKEYVAPRTCLSPKAVYHLGKRPYFFNENDNKYKIRRSQAYQHSYTEAVVSIGCRHILDAAPPDKWTHARVQRAARYQVEKLFGLLAA